MSAIDNVDKNVAISIVEKAISLSMKGVRVEKLISANVAIAMPTEMLEYCIRSRFVLELKVIHNLQNL